MNDLGPTFAVVASLFVLVLCLFVFMLVRRAYLRRSLGTVDASIRYRSRRWRMGVCRYQEGFLEWFPLLSLSLKPKYTFRRAELRVLSRRKPDENEKPYLQAGWVVVQAHCGNDDVLLGMRFGAYAGLSSWLEAGPVIGIGTWR